MPTRFLVSRAALEGERKLITVLFADIKGSMEVIADRDQRMSESFSMRCSSA